MRTTSKLAACSIATLGLFLLAGCPSKPKPAADVAPTPTPATTPTPAPVRTVTSDTGGYDSKPLTGEELPSDLVKLNAMGYLKTVNFEFDKYDVREDDKGKLQANADWLAKYPTVKVRIEGHCDERGTAQYNLALGEKRADAVKDYLVSLGISSSRLEIISYGKEKPLDPSQTEEAWAKNRRAQFLVTAR